LKLLNLLPSYLKKQVEHRPGLVNIIDNIGWLFFDKILRMGVGLLVGVWLARYLGPDQFGQLNYAIAFVGILSAVAGLGLNGIVVRDIVRKPEEARITLGTAFVLQVSGGILSVAITIGLINWLRSDDALTRTLVFVLSLSLLFRPTEVVKYWFEAQVQSRYTVWVENGAFAIASVVRIAMIIHQAPLLAFVWISLVEAVLVAIGLIAVYSMKNDLHGTLTPSLSRAKQLLNDCWPLIFSSLAVSIYLRIDQIMLAEMVGDREVGVYAAAVRLSEIWYFVPMIIVASVLPSIVSARTNNPQLYEERLQRLYDILVILAFSIAIPVTIFADVIIVGLFGREYLEAGSVLSINVWAGIFVFLGTACGAYTTSENLSRFSLVQNSFGMLTNISLNLILIPQLGSKGAAIATLISYAAATFSALAFSRTRRNGQSMLRALNIFRRI
jgi:O-antigen/teichoic acid export membrane protein